MMKLCMFVMFFDICLCCIHSAKEKVTYVSFRFGTPNSIFPILGTKQSHRPVEVLDLLIHRTSVFPGQRRCGALFSRWLYYQLPFLVLRARDDMSQL